MGIKQHNGNTKADRLAELKIRSPSIQLIKFGAIGLNAIIFSPLLIAADTGSQNGTNITINDGDRITGDTAGYFVAMSECVMLVALAVCNHLVG